MVVIEHNLELVPAQAGIIKTADHILDLGPGGGVRGGVRGGEIMVEGTPEKVTEVEGAFAGHYLKPMLERQKEAAEQVGISAPFG